MPAGEPATRPPVFPYVTVVTNVPEWAPARQGRRLPLDRSSGRILYTELVAMFARRALGLLALTLAIGIPSCQAVLPGGGPGNAPPSLSPGSFGESQQ